MSLPKKAASDDRILDFLSKLSQEIKEVKASVKNISISNEVEQQKTAEEKKAIKEAIKLEEFFKEIFKRPGPKIVQEVNVDEVEESPREKLWKKYGDYRGNCVLSKSRSLRPGILDPDIHVLGPPKTDCIFGRPATHLATHLVVLIIVLVLVF